MHIIFVYLNGFVRHIFFSLGLGDGCSDGNGSIHCYNSGDSDGYNLGDGYVSGYGDVCGNGYGEGYYKSEMMSLPLEEK